MKSLLVRLIRSLPLSVCLGLSPAAASGAVGPTVSFAPVPTNSTLVPHTVYVGDLGRLLLQFDPAAGMPSRLPFIAESAADLPRTGDVTVKRVELLSAEGALHARIDFVAFRTGPVEIPEIRLDGFALPAMEVRIASILAQEDGQGELSPAQEPLAASGTAVLLYGSVFALLALVSCASWFAFRGLPLLLGSSERRRLALASRSLRRVMASLREDCESLDPAEALAILSRELRSFLTSRTGINYLAMTSDDVRRMHRLSGDDDGFLASLFRLTDEVRFGGRFCPPDEIRDRLRGVEALIARMDSTTETGKEMKGKAVC